VVNFVLSRRGGRIFERETGRHVNDYMAIILDGRSQGQTPVIKSQIGQRGQIELGAKRCRTPRIWRWCSRRGRSRSPHDHRGAHIGPSLGQDSIRDGIRAGSCVALVVLIMVGYYRLSGVLSVAALALYVLFTWPGSRASGSRSRSRGSPDWCCRRLAVDANVLIFERIREELRTGSWCAPPWTRASARQ